MKLKSFFVLNNSQSMFNPSKLIEKAKSSSFYLTLLNAGLARMIPFNKPHRYKIVDIGDYHVKTRIPYIRKNFNHIRGLHACSLATISEFTTGFLLISKLDATKYRLIMQKMEMEYHYQGKMDAYAEFAVSDTWLQESIFAPLSSQDSVIVVCIVKITDVQGNHLTTGHIHWQIKNWSKVKTKS